MQKKIKVVFASLLCACVASTIGMTACGKDGTTPRIGDNGNWFIGETDTGVKAEGGSGKSAYQVWLDAGNTGTEQDFLDSLKGADGNNGVSPEIKDGYWWIDDTNTNIKAEGANGERGNKITKGEGAPVSTEGAIEGDMYVDTNEWNVYFFEDSEWKDYGSIKGGDAEPVKPTGNQVDIAANGEQTISVTLSEGVHIIEADLGDTELSTGRLKMHVSGKEDNSELVFSESRSQAQHNVYFGYINIVDGDSQITFETTDEAVKADISFKDYEMPTLKADGQPVEVPVNLYGKSDLKFKVDSSIQMGKHIIKIKCTADPLASYIDTTTYGRLKVCLGHEFNVTASKFESGYEAELSSEYLSELQSVGYLGYVNVGVNNASEPAIYPVTITLTKSS